MTDCSHILLSYEGADALMEEKHRMDPDQAFPDHLNPQAQSLPRVPRLSYRIMNFDSESIKTTSTDASGITTSTNATSPMQSTFCPSPKEPPSGLASSTSLQPPSGASSAVVSRRPSSPSKDSLQKSSKKRPSFFSGFFGAKEPSAQAFAEYEKRLLKQGHGRTSTLGLPGVSSTKLPPTVPKVNSRWDGVPETLKEKEKRKQETMQPTLRHSRGSSTIRTAGADNRPISTAASQERFSRGTLGGMSTHTSSGSTNRLADLYGWEVGSNNGSSSSSAVVDFATEHRPNTARLQTSYSAPAPLERPPPLDRNTVFPPHVQPYDPTSTQPQFEFSSPGVFNSFEVPSHTSSPALTPLESSPVTPHTPNNLTPAEDSNLDSPGSEASQTDNLKVTVLEAPASFDEVIVRSAGLNILGPPATVKRRTKASPCGPTDNGLKTSGLDISLPSILKKPSLTKAPPSMPDSYFPRISPAPQPAILRPDSARERLGLSMSLTNHAVAPWASPGDDGGLITGGERNMTPTPEGGQLSKKRSRMFKFKH